MLIWFKNTTSNSYSFRLVTKKNLSILLFILLPVQFAWADQNLANCVEIDGAGEMTGDSPKTREEQILQLESQYFNQLSKFKPCESGTDNTVDNEKAKQTVNSATLATENLNSEGAESKRLEQTGDNDSSAKSDKNGETAGLKGEPSNNDPLNRERAGGVEGAQSISSNLKKKEESPLAINSEGNLILETLDFDEYDKSTEPKENNSLSGRSHDKLKNVDNIEILKNQLRERAEREEDPMVKESLMRRYEEL